MRDVQALAELDQAEADLDAYDRCMALLEPHMSDGTTTLLEALTAMPEAERTECIRLGKIAGLFA